MSRLSTSDELTLGLVLIIAGFGALVALASGGLQWSFGALLTLAFWGAGGIFLGRAISRLQVRQRAANPERARALLSAPTPTMVFLAQLPGWTLLVSAVAAWILVALPVLGPLTTLKGALTLFVTVGLGLSFDVGNAFAKRRRKRAAAYVAGRHVARSGYWSARRRGIAGITGALVLFIGTWQGLGYGVAPDDPAGGMGGYALRSGLCFIFACAIGLILIRLAVVNRPDHDASKP